MIIENLLQSIREEKNMKATREGFGEALLEVGFDERVMAICADLTESVQMHKFRDAYPLRFLEVGIAEQNMAGVASGLAASGMIPFMASYAAFNPGRNWEQIRTTICYNNQKVIVVGAHAGLSVGPDGGTHQALEDIALMRVLPNITVLSPADAVEAKALTKLAKDVAGPVYIRLAREKSPIIFAENYQPVIGKPEIVFVSKIESAKKVGIIATGPILAEALLAAEELEKQNISVSVMNMHTIKPIDESAVIRFANANKTLVTVEESQVAGGLGSAISEILSAHRPTHIHMVGVKNRYGQSGTRRELYREYEIDKEAIVAAGLVAAHKI